MLGLGLDIRNRSCASSRGILYYVGEVGFRRLGLRAVGFSLLLDGPYKDAATADGNNWHQ